MATVWRFELEALNLKTLQSQLSTAHVQTDVTIGEDEPSGADVLDIILDHFSTTGHDLVDITTALYSSCRLTEARVREELHPTSSDIASVSTEALSLPGLNVDSGDVTPDGLCPWIFFHTPFASRSARGGTHLPGPFNANILDTLGRWDTTGGWWGSVSACANAFADHMENTLAASGDLNWVVYSRTRRGRGQSPWTFKLDDAGVRIQPRWLRRRMLPN